MGTLQFIVELAKALAWPAVAVLFLWLTRRHLGAALARLAKLTLPGGFAAEFNKEMTDARQREIELVATDKPLPPPEMRPSPADQAIMAATTTGIDRFFALASISPEAAIIETYSVLESIAKSFERKIPTHLRDSLFNAVRDLQEHGHIDQKWLDLLASVRHMRNLAAHGKLKDDLTFNDALNYQNLCRSLSDKLFEVFSELPDQENGIGENSWNSA